MCNIIDAIYLIQYNIICVYINLSEIWIKLNLKTDIVYGLGIPHL